MRWNLRRAVMWLRDISFCNQPSRSLRHTKQSSSEILPTAMSVMVFCHGSGLQQYSEHSAHGRKDWLLSVHKFRGGMNNGWQDATSHFIWSQKNEQKASVRCSPTASDQNRAGEVQCFGPTVRTSSALDNCSLKLSILLSGRNTSSWKLRSWSCMVYKQTHPQNSDQSHTNFGCRGSLKDHPGSCEKKGWPT